MYEVFEALCKEKGVRPSEVSRETGVSSAALSSWKTGRYFPKTDKLQKIADYFGVTMEYLMTGENPMEYVPPVMQELLEAADGCAPEDLALASGILRRLKTYRRMTER